MGEPVNITIADSAQFITDKFETLKNNSLAVLNEHVKDHTVSRDKERFSTMKQFYQKKDKSESPYCGFIDKDRRHTSPSL